MGVMLENEILTVNTAEKGAEITSIRDKKDGAEYIWTADPAFWGRHAPVLFPIVGRLKNNEYRIDGRTYKMGQHGFARDMEFEVVQKSESKVRFRLSCSEDTLKVYPYRFELYIEYVLEGSSLKVIYTVRNADNGDIYFSIGAHPGFNCPIVNRELGKAAKFEDYYFRFQDRETAEITQIDGSGLLKRRKKPFLKDRDIIPLSHELFKDDALVFGGLSSKNILLKNNKDSRGIMLDFSGFSYLGLWSKPEGAPFVCVEPWFGHADYEDFDGDYREREGVLRLGVGQDFVCSYVISILL